MSRTPLLHQLGLALHAYRRANETGIPIDEVLAHDNRKLDRRQFIAACLGASAAAVGLHGCGGEARAAETAPVDDTPAGKGPLVAVIGAGIAGLHCAYRLKRAGIDVRVYEGSERVGGRMATNRTTFPGMKCELGGEFVDTGHTTMHRLSRELGLMLFDYQMDPQKVETTVGFIAGRKLGRDEMLKGFAPIAAQINKALRSLKDKDAGVTFADANGGEALDQLSLAAWLDSVGAQGPMRKVLEVAYTIEFGLDPDKNNVLNMLQMISTEANELALFGESDERFFAPGGLDQFPAALAERLGDGQIKTGHALEAVKELADGRYTLSFKKDRGATSVTADHVVLALPFSVLRALKIEAKLPEVKRRAIAEIGYGDNTKLMVGFTSRPWRDQGSAGQVFTDLPFQNTWDTSRLQSGKAGIITNYTGGKHALDLAAGDVGTHASAFVTDFERIFPGAQAASTKATVMMPWSSNKWSRGSYSSYLVGQYTAFAGCEPERAGNLHFCGEHTCLDAQGYMEGGALSGLIAAAEVGTDLGVKIASAPATARERRLAKRKVVADLAGTMT
jgi:monoamine oxidase